MLRTLFERDRALALAATAMLAGLVVVGAIAPFDERLITGVNPWIMPMKFLGSIAVNTVAAAAMLWKLRRDTPAGRAGYLAGVRLGLGLL